jgi:hypothetical protein
MHQQAIFNMSYLGPVELFVSLLGYSEIYWEAHENFPKQSYRNRCYIGGPNGVEMLNIPIDHQSPKGTADIKISFQQAWPEKHWQAIKTAYGNSPFFDSLAPELELAYQNVPEKLWDWNLKLHNIISKWLRLTLPINPTQKWFPRHPDLDDLRDHFHPKKETSIKLPSYPQSFDHKHGFRANLSIIDLIFHEGPAAASYLKGVAARRSAR